MGSSGVARGSSVVLRAADYGIKGDWTGGLTGSGTNETATIQALIDRAPSGSTIIFEPTATYRFDNLIISGKVVHLDFNGAALVVKPWDGSASSAPAAIHVTGSTTTPRAISPAVAGAKVVTLTTPAESADFAVGDLVVVQDDAVLTGWDGNRNQVGRRELNYVSAINSGTGAITLSSPLEQTFDTTPKVSKVNALLAPTIKNISSMVQIDAGGGWSTTNTDFAGVDTNTPHLISVRYAIRPRVESVTCSQWDMQALVFSYCDQPYAGDVSGRFPYRPTVGGHGYLGRMIACRNGRFDRLYSNGVRHTADYVMTIDCGSTNCVAVDTVISSYVAHGIQAFRTYSTDDVVIQSSTAAFGWGLGNPTFGADYGFIITRPRFRGVGNVFQANYNSTGLTVLDADVVTDRRPFYCTVGVSGVTARGGRYRMTNPASASFAAADGFFDMRRSESSAPFGTTITTTTDNGDVTIENVDLYGATQHLAIETAGDVVARDVRFRSPSENYGGSTLIYLYSTAPRNLIVDRNLIDGGTVRNHVRSLLVPTGRQEYTRNNAKALLANSIVGEITATTLVRDNRYTLADGTTAVEMSLTNANLLEARKQAGAVVAGNFPATYDGVAAQSLLGVYAPSRFHGLSTRMMAAGTTFVSRFMLDRARTVTGATFSVSIAAIANDSIDIAIWDGDTGAKLASTGVTAGLVNTTGLKTVTFTAPVKLVPGKSYYIGITNPSTLGGTAATVDAVSAGGTGSALAQLFGSAAPNIEVASASAGGTSPVTLPALSPAGTGPLFAVLGS